METCQLGEKTILVCSLLASTLQSHIPCVNLKRGATPFEGCSGHEFVPYRSIKDARWCQISRGLKGWYAVCCRGRAGLWWESRLYASPRHTPAANSSISSDNDGGVRAPSLHKRCWVATNNSKAGITREHWLPQTPMASTPQHMHIRSPLLRRPCTQLHICLHCICGVNHSESIHTHCAITWEDREDP